MLVGCSRPTRGTGECMTDNKPIRRSDEVWPSGDGEMARRVREHNWLATSLGPLSDWPQSLMKAVDIILAMPGPATILWGPDSAQIYNDAYIVVASERHPALLGRPVAEGWPDAYESLIAPFLERTRAGMATQLADLTVQT